jgi:hypothetical protein
MSDVRCKGQQLLEQKKALIDADSMNLVDNVKRDV